MYASAYTGGGATASFAQVSGTPRKGYTGIIQGLYYTGGTPLGNIIGLFRRGTPRLYIFIFYPLDAINRISKYCIGKETFPMEWRIF